MLKDNHVRRLFKLYQEKKTIRAAALRAGINEKTASRYINSRKLPSELKSEHTWKTRPCPFKDDWPEIRDLLKNNEGLQAKTIFEYLQKCNPGVYADGQLRTLQRHIKIWRAAEGPPKEVYFPQIHYPGELCQSDFSDLSNIGVTIQGNNFEHLLFHFVLTYSNWEAGTICFSESFESLYHKGIISCNALKARIQSIKFWLTKCCLEVRRRAEKSSNGPIVSGCE